MSWMEFVASLAGSLAWPTSLVIAVLVFRKQFIVLLSGQLQHLKAGPVEMAFFQRVPVIKAQLEVLPSEIIAGSQQNLADSLRQLAKESPAAAVLRAHAALEERLRALLREDGQDADRSWEIRRLVGEAHARKLLTDAIVRAIDGVTVLRDLTVEGHAADLSTERASDYLALVDSILFSLDHSAPS